MDGLTIGDVARQSGMHASAIRFYESAGLLPAPERVGGWRTYTPDVLWQLRVIRAARGLGFTVDELRILIDGFSEDRPPSDRWREMAAEKLPQVDDLIARANAMKQVLEAGLRCECLRVDECFGDNGDVCSSENSCS